MSDKAPVVFVVDDDPSVRKSLKRLLDAEGLISSIFDSAQAFLEYPLPDTAGCVILDLAMPGLDGLQVQRALADRGSLLPVIFLTGHGDVHSSVRAMKSGAADFLTKPIAKADLLAAVDAAIRNCEAKQRAQRDVDEIRERVAALTPREREVMTHLLAGKLNKQIASDLGAAEYTIKLHRSRIMRKMRAPSLVELTRLAERAGIRPPSG